MYKKIICLGLCFMIMLFTGCQSADKEMSSTKIMKPVKVMQSELENVSINLHYTGLIKPNELKKLSFKKPGQIQKIGVKKGDKIRVGTVLVAQDKEDYNFAVDAAEAQYNAAVAQYNKAKNGASKEEVNSAKINVDKAKLAYEQSEKDYQDYLELSDKGALAASQLEKAKLDRDVKKSTYDQANEVYQQLKNGAREEDKNSLGSKVEAANVDLNYKKKQLKDTVVSSDIDGIVVDVLSKEGEIVAAGYPVVIIRDNKEVVDFGIVQKDINKIKLGSSVDIEADGVKAKGTITRIDELPDDATRTYNVQVTLDENKYKLGSIVKLSIPVQQKKGIWLPIKVVRSNGCDYVYVVKEGKVEKREVKLIQTNSTNVLVEGIAEGEQVIVEGINRIKVNDTVTVLE